MPVTRHVYCSTDVYRRRKIGAVVTVAHDDTAKAANDDAFEHGNLAFSGSDERTKYDVKHKFAGLDPVKLAKIKVPEPLMMSMKDAETTSQKRRQLGLAPLATSKLMIYSKATGLQRVAQHGKDEGKKGKHDPDQGSSVIVPIRDVYAHILSYRNAKRMVNTVIPLVMRVYPSLNGRSIQCTVVEVRPSIGTTSIAFSERNDVAKVSMVYDSCDTFASSKKDDVSHPVLTKLFGTFAKPKDAFVDETMKSALRGFETEYGNGIKQFYQKIVQQPPYNFDSVVDVISQLTGVPRADLEHAYTYLHGKNAEFFVKYNTFVSKQIEEAGETGPVYFTHYRALLVVRIYHLYLFTVIFISFAAMRPATLNSHILVQTLGMLLYKLNSMELLESSTTNFTYKSAPHQVAIENVINLKNNTVEIDAVVSDDLLTTLRTQLPRSLDAVTIFYSNANSYCSTLAHSQNGLQSIVSNPTATATATRVPQNIVIVSTLPTQRMVLNTKSNQLVALRPTLSGSNADAKRDGNQTKSQFNKPPVDIRLMQFVTLHAEAVVQKITEAQTVPVYLIEQVAALRTISTELVDIGQVERTFGAKLQVISNSFSAYRDYIANVPVLTIVTRNGPVKTVMRFIGPSVEIKLSPMGTVAEPALQTITEFFKAVAAERASYKLITNSGELVWQHVRETYMNHYNMMSGVLAGHVHRQIKWAADRAVFTTNPAYKALRLMEYELKHRDVRFRLSIDIQTGRRLKAPRGRGLMAAQEDDDIIRDANKDFGPRGMLSLSNACMLMIRVDAIASRLNVAYINSVYDIKIGYPDADGKPYTVLDIHPRYGTTSSTKQPNCAYIIAGDVCNSTNSNANWYRFHPLWKTAFDLKSPIDKTNIAVKTEKGDTAKWDRRRQAWIRAPGFSEAVAASIKAETEAEEARQRGGPVLTEPRQKVTGESRDAFLRANRELFLYDDEGRPVFRDRLESTADHVIAISAAIVYNLNCASKTEMRELKDLCERCYEIARELPGVQRLLAFCVPEEMEQSDIVQDLLATVWRGKASGTRHVFIEDSYNSLKMFWIVYNVLPPTPAPLVCLERF